MNCYDLSGKVALVTGGTQGLGAAVARRMAESGAKVMFTGRSDEKGAERLAALTSLGHDAAFIAGDLADESFCRAVVDAALERYGRLDVLVNSAADTRRSTLRTMTPDLFAYQFNLNVRAPLLLAQRALEALRKDHGAIINIGSVNAPIGGSDLLIYSATKGALMTASRNLARALQFERVRVYCLNVGWMDSDGERAIQASLGKPEDFIDVEGAKRPLGRLITPEEVASVCAFLASNEAKAFSGAVIELEQSPSNGW